MSRYMANYAITFIISFGLAFLLTPLVKKVSSKRGWMDRPNNRKVNKEPVPLLGGAAIYAAFVAGVLTFFLRGSYSGDVSKLAGILAGSLVIVLIGIEDDIRGVSPRRKLAYQIIASVLAVLFGFLIIQVSHPLGGHFRLSAVLSVGLTVFWIVGFTNAVNLIDGLDGLASGITAIIAGSLFFAAVKNGNVFVAVLSAALAGSSLGFLPFNFHPAKIFMGDTGSMFLGFILALISIEGAQKGPALFTLFIPVIAMGVPVVDTLLSILRRLVKGDKVFKPDKEHIHHQLILFGNSQKDAVLRLYFLTACFGLIAVSFTGLNGIWALIALVMTAMLALRWVINSGFLDFVDKVESRKEDDRGKQEKGEMYHI